MKYVVVPLEVFQAAVNTLGTLPWNQVGGLMRGLEGLPVVDEPREQQIPMMMEKN